MPKEYRTIQEVAGPLMLVKGVEGVKYDELGEIELASGETRRCKVLEVNGSDVLVQLFESSTGINLIQQQGFVSWGGAWSLECPRICWAAFRRAGASQRAISELRDRRSCRMRAWISTDFP